MGCSNSTGASEGATTGASGSASGDIAQKGNGSWEENEDGVDVWVPAEGEDREKDDDGIRVNAAGAGQ